MVKRSKPSKRKRCSPTRVLLDECIPLQVVADLPKHDERTIRGMRWRGKKNGELPHLASSNSGVFVTIDRSLAWSLYLRRATNLTYFVR
jgi:predicted nuclease of predicted toxin-antitoxin system